MCRVILWPAVSDLLSLVLMTLPTHTEKLYDITTARNFGVLLETRLVRVFEYEHGAYILLLTEQEGFDLLCVCCIFAQRFSPNKTTTQT